MKKAEFTYTKYLQPLQCSGLLRHVTAIDYSTEMCYMGLLQRWRVIA